MTFAEPLRCPELLKCSKCGAEFLYIKEGKHEKTASR
jgi:hypothetical protein